MISRMRKPTSVASHDSQWPPVDLEAVPQCEICGESRRSLWLKDLSDKIFRAAPGRWSLWRCDNCSAAQLDPRPTPQSIGRAYSTYYTHQQAEKHFLIAGDRSNLRLKRALHLSYYNHEYGHRLQGACPLGWLAIGASRRRRVRAGQFIRHLPGPASGQRLLDVGCGDGSFLRLARALGFSPSGIEFDPAAASLAQSQGFNIQIGAIADAEIAEASIDHITLNHVIEHLHQPVVALRRMWQWLRPGGRIWLQTPNINSKGAALYAADWRGLEPPRHLVMFNPRSLQFALEKSGFERVKLMPPQLDAQFYIGQSEAIRSGRDPYLQNRAQRREARNIGNTWNRDALDQPEQAESITMIGYRPD
jgi:2-polyprenyl-3-methyl-5-hydroxy-6-metoxy-1,4-benzoquinol methylase